MSGLVYITFPFSLVLLARGWNFVIGCYIINKIKGGPERKVRTRQKFLVSARICSRIEFSTFNIQCSKVVLVRVDKLTWETRLLHLFHITHTQTACIWTLCCGLSVFVITRCFTESLTHSLLSLLQHNVFWFQISVDDPLLVEIG